MNGNKVEAVPHVVIIGAGFAGLSAAKALAKAPVRVTVLDMQNHHLFQPLLYQVAMAGLSPAEIAYPIRSILRKQKNVEVRLAQASSIDLGRKLVHTNRGAVSYDYLILAAGARTFYFGNDHWVKHAVGLKDIDDAIEIRRRVLAAFEEAECEPDPERRKQLLTFVVIGGGATGVELAGSLAELARFALRRDFRNICPRDAQILMLEGGPRILNAYPEDLSANAHRQLERMGVQIRTGVKVSAVDPENAYLEVQQGTGPEAKIVRETIPSRTVMWCAGVASVQLTETLGVPLDRAGRVIVQPDLSIPGYPEAFAVGDLSLFTHQDGKPLPGLAPVAAQQGEAAARAIIATVKGAERKPFRYKHRGSLATIGRSAAIAEFGNFKLTGSIAWFAWLLIHIMFLIGFKNKLVVMINWAYSYITYQRGSRLITGRKSLPR